MSGRLWALRFGSGYPSGPLISSQIVESSKELLELMGVPWIQGHSEGDSGWRSWLRRRFLMNKLRARRPSDASHSQDDGAADRGVDEGGKGPA
jgi:hypothetical protein